MSVQKRTGGGKAKKTFPTSQFGSVWYTSWEPVIVKEEEGRCPKTVKQAGMSRSPGGCRDRWMFSPCTEDMGAVLLSLGDQLLAQQQMSYMVFKEFG